MVPKLKILRMLVPNAAPLKIDYSSILTKYELCTLHKLMSSSVDSFERRNEAKSCPIEGLDEAHSNRRWVNPFTVESR